jgi:hypothetical protein
VTSDRRQRANRINAKSSTGPKTVQGKARVAQNAFRHGLNVPVINNVEHAPEIEPLARRLAGVDGDEEVLEFARRVSEAQVDLNRVRAARRRFIINRFAVTDATRPNPLAKASTEYFQRPDLRASRDFVPQNLQSASSISVERLPNDLSINGYDNIIFW